MSDLKRLKKFWTKSQPAPGEATTLVYADWPKVGRPPGLWVLRRALSGESPALYTLPPPYHVLECCTAYRLDKIMANNLNGALLRVLDVCRPGSWYDATSRMALVCGVSVDVFRLVWQALTPANDQNGPASWYGPYGTAAKIVQAFGFAPLFYDWSRVVVPHPDDPKKVFWTEDLKNAAADLASDKLLA